MSEPEIQSRRIPGRWGELIHVEDLDPTCWPEDIRMLCELLGMGTTLALIEHFEGNQIYIPKLDGLLKTARNRAIHRAFNGGNHKELARRFGIATSTVYTIIAQKE